jgi:hypothetical protein
MTARPFRWPLSSSCHGGAKPPPLKPVKKPKD